MEFTKNQLAQSLDHILDNVEIKAEASSSFTVETVDNRIAVLEEQLLDLGKEPRGRLLPSWKKASDELEYLRNLKARKGWA